MPCWQETSLKRLKRTSYVFDVFFNKETVGVSWHCIDAVLMKFLFAFFLFFGLLGYFCVNGLLAIT